MSFRSIIISNPANLSVKNNNLMITNDLEHQVPIEDISVLVIEAESVKLTGRLISKLSESNVATIVCNEKHLPVSIILPLNTHHRTYKVLKQQFDQSAAFTKRIWQGVIKQKLYNQGEVLRLLEINGYDFLYKLSGAVESGDKGNREAIGAKFYFKTLFGDGFTRDDDNGINSALNYGYTIIRSAVARSLAMYGFNTTLGVNHCNELNSFNLADDFMEPFRPIVDLWVYENMSLDSILSRYDRIKLVDLVNVNCSIDGKNHSILNAIDKMVASYTTTLNKKDFRLLKLPKLKSLEYHYYE